MVRIFLIIEIVAGIAALAVSQLVVATKINTMTSDLDTIKQTKDELDLLTVVKIKVEWPLDLKGKVVAFDPKYEFVVLDIVLDDGVLARGEMLVNRSGKLVAKVRILTAESHRSVANVLADWKQGEIMEGDVGLVGL